MECKGLIRCDPALFGSTKVLIFKMIGKAAAFSNLNPKTNQKEGPV